MGNKNSHQRVGAVENDKLSADLKTEVDNDEDVFPYMLSRLPIPFSEEDFDLISYDVEKKTFVENTSILRSGGEPEGIYLILNGKCKVLDEENNVINILSEKDIFGEISVLYNQNVSCDILSISDLETLFIHQLSLKDVIKKSRLMDIKDWYFYQKYVDTNNCFIDDKIEKIFLREHLLNTHMFEGWQNDALEFVIDQAENINICLYQPDTIIFQENVTENQFYILIKGAIQVYSKSIVLAELNIKPHECFLFGDECLFSNQARLVSVKTTLVSQILIFDGEVLRNLSKHFPTEFSKLLSVNQKWKQFKEEQNLLSDQEEIIYTNCVALNINLQKIPQLMEEPLSYLFSVATTARFKKLNIHQVYDCSLLRDSSEKTLFIAVVYGKVIFMKHNGFDKQHSPFGGLEKLDDNEQIEAQSEICIIAVMSL